MTNGGFVFTLGRFYYRGLTTIGRMIFPDQRSFWTLEDCVRGWGIKDGKNTAIPAGKYKMTVSMSGKFGREMVMIYTEDNKYELKAGGIEFKGIRAHGGLTHLHTWGCIIIAHNRPTESTVADSAEKEFTDAVRDLIKSGMQPILEVKNLHQNQ